MPYKLICVNAYVKYLNNINMKLINLINLIKINMKSINQIKNIFLIICGQMFVFLHLLECYAFVLATSWRQNL